jgi:hypothetical protein
VEGVVCFLLGNSSVSEFYMPTFRNTLFHLQPMMMEQTECFEAYKIQTPGNYPEENVQLSEHDESLKLRMVESVYCAVRTDSLFNF